MVQDSRYFLKEPLDVFLPVVIDLWPYMMFVFFSFQAGGQIKLMVLREEDVDGQEADSHSLASGSDVNASSWVNINYVTLLCVRF